VGEARGVGSLGGGVGVGIGRKELVQGGAVGAVLGIQGIVVGRLSAALHVEAPHG